MAETAAPAVVMPMILFQMRHSVLCCLAALVSGTALGGTNDYPVAPAFGGIVFQQPVQVVFAPGETNRAFVVEREGRIAHAPT